METTKNIGLYESCLGAVVNHEKRLSFVEMARNWTEGVGMLAVRPDGVYRISGAFRTGDKIAYCLQTADKYFMTFDPGIICTSNIVEDVGRDTWKNYSADEMMEFARNIDALDMDEIDDDTVVGLSSYIYKGWAHWIPIHAVHADRDLKKYLE